MKKSITLIFLASSAFLFAEALPKYESIVDRCGLSIETPALAKRQTCKLRLTNDLEVLLISDPETHESGAALSVEVGSWDDPEDRPGMAHFVEHLLFLGTEKYPEESGYTRYLDEHGGNRNAFTMADRTVYAFSVDNGAFSEALDRFGQFFIAPLFNPSGVERESKAIHQEYCKNVPLDPWRMHFVKKELANKKHPFHGFCIGNQETLAQISQDELKSWYAEHYSANLMHLIVYSPLDIATLKKEVVSLFSQIKNQKKQASKHTEPLLIEDDAPTLCVITPVQELQLLELTWEIPRFYGKDKEIHADKLLSHVLGHEGSTSLLAQLKRENLAESLSVSNFRAGNDQCLLSLSVELTAKGIQDYEKVIQRCFEALATLQQNGVPRYIFDEVCKIKELSYTFQSREDIYDFVSDYAMRMIDEPLDTFPRQTLIPSVYEPEKVKELFAHLTPKTCKYTLMASPKLTKIDTTFKERWMGVEYALVPITAEKIHKWQQAALHTAMCIPRPNPFLPVDLTVKGQFCEKQTILAEPVVISDGPLGKIYEVEDSHYLVPEISWIFAFKTPHISDGNPLSHAMADLFCYTVSESLKTSSYEALMGGLSFSLQPKHGSLVLKIEGYSDKAMALLKTVVSAMKGACPTKEQFAQYKQTFARDYANTLKATPLKQGIELLSAVLYKEFSGLEQKSAALKELSFDQMRLFCQNVLSTCYVEGMLFGNVTKEEAQSVWETIKVNLPFTAYPPDLHPKIELANLPSQEDPSYLLITSEHPANALILALDCGNFSFKRRAAQEILSKGLEEPFFSELRTRQQTAYLVTNFSQELERHLYSFFAIQSSSHDTRDLLARFELFIETSLQRLTDEVIPKSRFESIRTSYINQLQHPAENLNKMGELMHTIAFQYEGDFNWLEKRIEAFKELSYEEFVEYAKEFLGKENRRRLALCVNGELPQKESMAYRSITTLEKLRSEIFYESKEAIKK